MISDRFTHQFLIDKGTVNICRIEKINAEDKSAMNRGYGFGIVSSAIKFGHPHAAQSQSRNFQALRSQFAFLHRKTSSPGEASKSLYGFLIG